MRLVSGLQAAIAATAMLALPSVNAQDAPTVKVDVKDMKVAQQSTPQIQATNVTDKRWKPKTWLEIDMAIEAKKAQQPGDRNPFVESLDVKYYVVLNKQDTGGKYIVLTASITYLNILAKEVCHAMAFASPPALARLLEKPDFSNADVRAYGVEINHNGQLVGGYSSMGGKFWETSAANFTMVDGVLLPKAKTPFSTLWGDYDLESKQ